MERKGSRDMRIADFKNARRATMIPVISATGDVRPTFLVFKGTRVPFQWTLRVGVVRQEIYHDILPRGAPVPIREQHVGVDLMNFLNCAHELVRIIFDHNAGGRKVLLLYDSYRSHMSLSVLELFGQCDVVVQVLPEQKSGKTQSLDVVV